jgi:uncharacterized protein
MPLAINLRHLEARDIQLKGKLPASELDLGLRDDIIRAEKPLCYELEVQKLENAVLVQGHLRLTLQCLCVRCLKPFEYSLELKNWTRHLALEGEEKATVVNDCVDLTAFAREDILLEFPQHPLCEANCGGPPKTFNGRAKKAGGADRPKEKVSVWAKLDKLKL